MRFLVLVTAFALATPAMAFDPVEAILKCDVQHSHVSQKKAYKKCLQKVRQKVNDKERFEELIRQATFIKTVQEMS